MIALGDVQASLSLFAEAIAGESVPFTTAEDRAGCWPWGPPADGTTVVLPISLETRSAFRGVLLHQVLSAPSPSTGRPLFDRLLQIVEDHRVVAVVRRDYPGAARDQQDLLDDAAASAVAAARSDLDAASTAEFGIPAVVRWLELRSLDVDRTTLVRLATWLDPRSVHGLLDVLDAVQAPEVGPATSRAVAQRLYEMLGAGERASMLLEEVEVGEDDEGSGVLEGAMGASLESGSPSKVVEGDTAGAGRPTSELGDAALDADEDEEDDEDTVRGGLQLTATEEPSLPAEIRTYVYDEWDYHLQRHRPAWCRVLEEPLAGEDHEFIVDVRRRHAALRSRLRRALTRLPPRELVRVRRALDGEEIDLDAAIEAVSDRRSGAPVDDRVTMRRDRGARDVATAFLVDLSASTSSPATPPEPEPEVVVDPMDDPMSYDSIWEAPPPVDPVRRVIDVAKDAVTLMGDALDELGDRFAVYGFSGTGRDGVEFKIGKDFGQRSTPSTWAAVAAMKPLRYTRMGPAIRHAAAKLSTESARTRLLVVISDGYPQDMDYGHDRTDRDYGIHDTARALADAEAAGIETFCLTIDPAGHDYLRVMCPDDRYLVIEDVESLPERLAECMIDLRRP